MRQHGGLVVKNCENFRHLWVFQGVWVICAKPPFLNSLDVPIKMFANSLAILNQQTLGRIDHVHLLSNTVDRKLQDCLVLGRQETYLLFLFVLKTVWIPRLGSGFMVSGIDLKFTSYSKIFLSSL